MSRFTVTSPQAQLFSAPALTAARTDVPAGTLVDAEPVPGTVIWVQTGPVAALPGTPSGFMRKADLGPGGDLPPEPVGDITAFLALVDAVSRDFGVDRDYLVAVAWAESGGLTQLGDAAGPGIGPFRFTAESWAQAIGDPRAKDHGLLPGDRRLWRAQVPMAAVSALLAGEALAAGGKPPTLGTLYFTQVFGTKAAGLLADAANPFDAAYTARFGADALTACRAAHSDVLGPPGSSVQSVLDALCARLDAAYVAAAPVLDGQRDDIRFFHAEVDDPRWLMVAREEAFRGVFEHPGADNNARISEYLKVSGLANSADEVPWCGAFAAFCLRRSGDAAVAASVPAGAARAANWLSWGSEAPESARGPGTVVVLKPQAANSSGHVGFLLQESAGDAAPAGKLRLLAGNQGQPQRVCALDFDEHQVADHGFRMFRPGAVPLPPAPPPAPNPGPGPAPAGAAGGFRALVPGGFFSSDPNGPAKRSIRANNPGALNFLPWQAERKGFFGKTQPDNTPGKNVTTIYLTPEHGVASWFTLLAVRYKLGRRYSIRTLAAKYAGSMLRADLYVTAWVDLSGGTLSPTSVVDTADDAGMLALAKAMFRNEAGVPTPLSDEQILFGIRHERAGTLPA